MLIGGLAWPATATVGPQGEWVPAGPPAAPNSLGGFGTLVMLPNGTALLVGKGVQQYVPSGGNWTAAGSLHGAGGVATVLANGQVLVSGLSPAEIYDPATQTSALTGPMVTPRSGHQATLLPSGQVLVSGGADVNGQLVANAETYDPVTGMWTAAGAMHSPRQRHTAILLPTGQVLAAGGSAGTVAVTSAELYDPATRNWAPTNSNVVGGAVSALLPNGKALVIGTVTDNFILSTASQVFDPSTGTWSPVAVATQVGSYEPVALTRLNDDRILLIGHVLSGACFLLGTGLYDPATGAWGPASVPSPNSGLFPSLVTLPDGRALLAMLQNCESNQPGAQLFRPDDTSARLALTPASVNFGSILRGTPVQQTVTVQNTGQDHLSGSASIGGGHGFSLVSGTGFSLDAGASSPTVFGFSSAALGIYTDVATFASNGGWASVRLTAIVGVTVSGRIALADGSGVPAVPVALQGAVSANTTTDADGVYTFIAPPGGYSVVPNSPTLTFSPTSRNVLVGDTDIGGLDFVAHANVSRDFNGDGKSDILWRHSSGVLYTWLMNGTSVGSAGSPGSVGPDWTIAGIADFNGDGKADILWRHSSGVVYLWLMDGTTVIGAGSPGSAPPDWSIVGVGDFNGDGKADILWRHTSGTTFIWLLDGTTVTGTGSPGSVGTDWSIVGVGDFNGDGKADILWRHDSGVLVTWFLNATSVTGTGVPGSVTTDWAIAGIGDFNRDGKADILWRHTSGVVYLWLMNGASILGQGSPGSVGVDWSIQGVPDFNGDGKADILWRHTSGVVYLWLMDGLSIIGTGSPGSVDPSWTIQ
jgi:hypothetical protein